MTKILVDKAVIEQALDALEELHYSSGTVVAARKHELATASMREALEQQEVSVANSPLSLRRCI